MLLDTRHQANVTLDEVAQLPCVAGPARTHDGERDEAAGGHCVRDARRREGQDVLRDDADSDHLEGSLKQRREDGRFNELQPVLRPKAGGDVAASSVGFAAAACVEQTPPPVVGA